MSTFKTFHTYADAEGEVLVSADDNNFSHNITYYVERKMTFDEWVALDDAMDEAFAKVFGDDFDGYVGLAGPIPFDNES